MDVFYIKKGKNQSYARSHVSCDATYCLYLLLLLLNIFIKSFFKLSSQYNYPNSVATNDISIRNYVYFHNM